jgi:pyruvate/2-oxoglutarate dehydrogenase complex dihydrolipoamide dehydrogenase (E3) component
MTSNLWKRQQEMLHSIDRKGVQVNDRMETTNPRIDAAGDICSPYPLTHAAD